MNIPNFPVPAKGPSKAATAIYPSNGPLLEFNGLPAIAFRLFSKAGSIAVANSKALPKPKSIPVSKKIRPAKEANALLTPGLELLISFTIKTVVSAGIGISDFRRNTSWRGRPAASTATAASCVSLASKGVLASTMDAETLEDGVRKPNIEYNATRWSGPAVFPDFGRLRSSVTEFESRSSDLARVIMFLNRWIELVRTTALLDFALLMIWVSTRQNMSDSSR